jgi:hypothetical protein
MNTERITGPILRAAVACALMFGIATAGARAQNSQTIMLGNTDVNLASSFISTLQGWGVTPGTVFPSRLTGTDANFPITGGALDLSSGKGQVLHSGGLTLTYGMKVVVLQSFILDTTNLSKPVITGIVSANGTYLGRMTIFDLTLPPGTSLPLNAPHGFLKLTGFGVTLDSGAASALNYIFNVTVIKGGMPIGTASAEGLLRPPTAGQ